MDRLEKLWNPTSIAVVGASRTPGKVGHDVFVNLLEGGYSRPVYPVNPNAGAVAGRTAYADFDSLPGPVDLAVITVPNIAVPEAMRQAGQAGVAAAIVISAGFRESGAEGARLELELQQAAADYGVRFLGPNCLGLINTAARMNATFAAGMPEAGPITLMSQSGALLTAILDWAKLEGVGFAQFVSLGNKADVTELDILRAAKTDAHSRVVCAYLEGVHDGAQFMQVTRELSRVKPVVVLKAGGTDAGARAVSSHTGALAGSENAYTAAFRQSGVVQAHTMQELFDLSRAFSLQSAPGGDRVVILTNAGGPAVLATDACERAGLPLAGLTSKTIDRLRQLLPPAASLYNPVDILGDAQADRYRQAASILLADPEADILLCLATPQAMTQAVQTAHALGELSAASGKTVVAGFMGGSEMVPAVDTLRHAGVPNFPFPERAVEALKGMATHSRLRGREQAPPARVPGDHETVRGLFEETRQLRRRSLPDLPALQVMAAYGIPTPKTALARSPAQAEEIGSDIGYPVAMKITSPDILHKSDVGGIRTDVDGSEEARRAFEDILATSALLLPQATVWGVSVQEQVEAAREVIIGMNRDPQFGPLLMFGLGGIYVEIMRDVSFRVLPISRKDALAMVREVQTFPLLRGARGGAPADIDAIVDCMVHVAQLCLDFPDILELDINPLMAREQGKGVVAVDARIVIGDGT